MALQELQFKSGFFSDDTDRDVGTMGYWKDGDKVRFRHGLPETIGGWEDSGSGAMVGTARGTVDWVSLRSEVFIAFGTSKKLYIWQGGQLFDITPIRASSTINNNPFSMTDTLAVVTVTDTAHGAEDGAYVTFSGATAAGGITIVGEYEITYIDADSYTITHSSPATSTTTGGGASVVAAYQINPGNVDSVQDVGWGVGGWGAETWGTPRSSSASVSAARTWALWTWGEDLIASHLNGGIYVWDSSVGTGTRSVIIATAPTNNKSVMVSQEARHLIALGAGGDPTFIQWCSSEDYNDWTATTTNTAGDARVDLGSALVCGVRVRDQHLIFTDAGEYNMQYVGPPYTFSLKPIGTRGIIGPNAVAVHTGVAYWMGIASFYRYDGTVQVIPCPVFNTVFNDINLLQRAKVWATVDATFDEIWWLYCSAASDEVDRYVVYNVIENHWVYGSLERTILVGDSDVIDTSYGVSSDGYLYYHNTGMTADGADLEAFVASGDVELNIKDNPVGNKFMHVSKVIPDFKTLSGDVTMTVTTKRYPQASETQSSGPHTITSSTEFINPRLRGRQLSLRVDSTSAGWRMGVPRVQFIPHGRR